MIQVGSRVRHKDSVIDNEKGIMSVIAIKNGIAICTYLDFARYGAGAWNYNVNELKLAEN